MTVLVGAFNMENEPFSEYCEILRNFIDTSTIHSPSPSPPLADQFFPNKADEQSGGTDHWPHTATATTSHGISAIWNMVLVAQSQNELSLLICTHQEAFDIVSLHSTDLL